MCWEQVKELNDELEEEKRRQIEQTQRQSGGSSGDRAKVKDNWSDVEIQMLIKAVNLFPAGTNAR